MKEESNTKGKQEDKVEIVTGQQRQLTVIAPLDPQYFAVDLSDWTFLKDEIEKLKPAFKWYELASGASLDSCAWSVVFLAASSLIEPLHQHGAITICPLRSPNTYQILQSPGYVGQLKNVKHTKAAP